MKKIKEKREIRKSKQAIALGEIFLMIISSLAFAFIIGGMGILSLSGVSAVTLSSTGLPANYNPSLLKKFVSTDGTYYIQYTDKNYVYNNGAWTQLSSPATFSSSGQSFDLGAGTTIYGTATQAPDMSTVPEGTPLSSIPYYDSYFQSQGRDTQIVWSQANGGTWAAAPGFKYDYSTGVGRIVPDETMAQNDASHSPELPGTGSVDQSNAATPPASTVIPNRAAPTQLREFGGNYAMTGKNGESSILTGGAGNVNPNGVSVASHLDTSNVKVGDIITDLNGDKYTVTKVGGGSLTYEGNGQTGYSSFADASERFLAQAHIAGASEASAREFSFLGMKMGTAQSSSGLWIAGNLAEGLGWASAVLGFANLIAGFMPSENSKNLVKSVGLAISAGIMGYRLAYGATTQQFFGTHSLAYTAANTETGKSLGWTTEGVGQTAGWVVGAAVAYFTFASQYKKEKEKTQSIEFKCMNWQAPRGGADCNKCNGNPQQPCSEYRCKALGQTCKLVNAGTGQDRCIDSSPNDVTSPGIKPWLGALTPGYAYKEVTERPPGKATSPGKMKIVYSASEDGCLPAFTPFGFGIITTDKDTSSSALVTQPAQCKIDYNHTKSFAEMGYYMDQDNLFIENHSQIMSMPSTNLIETLYGAQGNESTLPIQNDGEYTLYIRCQDGNGNANEDEFAVRFCIDKGEDLTVPVIKATSLPSGSAVLYKADNVSIDVYTNEPAECRWSRKDASYMNMENQMDCTNDLWEMNAEFLYTCKTTLTSVKDSQENKFYFRCQDLSKNKNAMQESYEYSLFGSQPLDILNVGPNGTIGGATSTVVATLNVETDNGFKSGESRCSYSPMDENKYIEMAETGGNKHSQQLDLTEGDYSYSFKCVDAGGNTAFSSTNFTIFVDRYAPVVVRVYNLDDKLVVITDENSNCRYSTESCNFDLNKLEGNVLPYDDNTVHLAEWKTDQNYYIKCSDKYNNQPNPSECSMVIRPYELQKE